MKKRFPWLTLSILILVILVGGCFPLGPRPSTNQAATYAAQTVEARLTEMALQTLIAQLTVTPAIPSPFPTATPGPQEATATPVPPTAVPTAQPTLVQPTPTATPLPCNWAKFVKDITVPDGTRFRPGEAFTKTWRLQNIGSCTWTADYALVFASGNAMDGPASQKLGTTVRPGETVDISVNLKAPTKPGDYTGNWKLRSADGVVFGLGRDASQPFWVKIKVLEPSQVAFDLAANYCTAEWRTSAGVLTCPSSGIDTTNGSITINNAPKLEGGRQEDEPALITVPSAGDGGFISGKFPVFKVAKGDRFKAIIGCLDGASNCNVMFQLNYIADGGSEQNLGSWTQTYDGKWESLDVDLSSLDGKSVQFILKVLNNGNSQDDLAFWLAPRVVR
ncbi:NBR1-Ig-like domain-containing protein [uncultured Thermanaerothrix sp.]|uniref:NBR1-Ig-like domain-containing protein n=1 Tax=uncultured Thermanaerothrix sp. TaxID=1195149 RepID=UPI002609E448|nr:NBR1-Ig-like domain-containing protein [uncultured Thermanaerothrix sp.]